MRIVCRWITYMLLAVSASAMLHADASPTASFVVDEVQLKENGRIDEHILKECNVQQALRDAIIASIETAKNRQRDTIDTLQSSGSDALARHIEVRLDKLARVPQATELGVTVRMTDTDRNKLFLCRASWKAGMFSPTQCSRVSYCTDRIVDDIARWLELRR